MLKPLKYLTQLYLLAVALRRHRALRALKHIELMPGWLPRLLKIVTFYIVPRRTLPAKDGERLAAALATMGPAYIKLGQTLATRPDLVGRPLAEGLATLQDRLPPFSTSEAKKTIETELGKPVEEIFSAFDDKAVAAASIAQVHKARLQDGTDVAVKVLRPGIEKRFNRDLALFDWLAHVGERRSVEARRLRLRQIVAKVRETVMSEMDLRLEAAAAAELASNMEGEAGYRLPGIEWELTSRSVMVLEWVNGIRVLDRDALIAAGHDVANLGRTVVQIFLKQALRDGYFHADLHQGNLLVEEDGTLVAIDFGIMGRLTKLERRFLAEILYGFIRRDYRRVAEVHFDAGYVPRSESIEEFAQAMRSIADPIMDLPVEEISAGKLLAQLFSTTERFKMKTQPQLLVLQRTMVMAEGMALHLNSRSNMWLMSEPVIEAWVRDNLSPEIQLAETLNKLPRLLERLPARLERWLEDEEPRPEQASDDPDVIHPQPAARLWPFALGLVVGALVLKILTF